MSIESFLREDIPVSREVSLTITDAYRNRFPGLSFGIGTIEDCVYFEKSESFKLQKRELLRKMRRKANLAQIEERINLYDQSFREWGYPCPLPGHLKRTKGWFGVRKGRSFSVTKKGLSVPSSRVRILRRRSTRRPRTSSSMFSPPREFRRSRFQMEFSWPWRFLENLAMEKTPGGRSLRPEAKGSSIFQSFLRSGPIPFSTTFSKTFC